MPKQVAALKPNDHNALPQANAPPAASALGLGRFQYASGDSPLAGYAIKRGVGQGGFGEIYYATSDAGKDVALKLIRRNLDVELRGIRQCLNLKHPHLLDLYDIRQDDRGDTWVVMEYVADQNLEDVLAVRPDGLSPEEALDWIHGIGAGVAYLHDRGIVHRDLKPGNIFRDEGVVKLGDYGLSKFISCSRRSGHTESIGTVHYMAPEVANGRYGKEIDVYALGVILYELLTGHVPFEGESVAEVLMKHLTAKPDVSMLSEPYRHIVARALEKDPALRFRSAAEMLAALPPATAQPIIYNSGRDDHGRQSVVAEAGSPAEQTVVADAVPEEPILRALCDVWQSIRRAWDNANLNMPAKILILLAGLFVLVTNAGILVPLAIALCVLYALYRIVWMFVGDGKSPTICKEPTPAMPQSEPPVLHPLPERRGWLRRHEKPAAATIVEPPRERVTQLIGSLLISVLAAVAMCLVMVLIESLHADAAAAAQLEQSVWLLLVGVIGSWSVLVLSKLWEGVRGDPMVRRFILMIVGMGVGAVAFGASQWLMVGLPAAAGYPEPPAYRLPLSFYAIDGRPLLMAYVGCFGTMFLLVRWWLQTDPSRSTRLSLWKLTTTVLVAGVVAWAWQFPQPWLPMVAATISVSVQLASPWRHSGQRWRHPNGSGRTP